MRQIAVAALLALTLAATSAAAQSSRQYRARLSPVPIDAAMQATIAGSGSVTATLAGSKLTISGTFEGLKSPATVARVHVAPKGLRGPSILELTVSPGTSGTIGGAFDLTPAQLEDLTKSRFYLQLHSEKAPDGNLWGWLLPHAPAQSPRGGGPAKPRESRR
jgi:hypothetical protein